MSDQMESPAEKQERLTQARAKVMEILGRHGYRALEDIKNPAEESEIRAQIQREMDQFKPSVRAKRPEKMAEAMTRIDRSQEIVDQYAGKNPSMKYRMCNVNPDVQALRRNQGWEPVLDEKGGFIRNGDLLLMSMDKQKFRESVQKPKETKRALRRAAVASIQEQFASVGDQAGVETYGKIKFDKPEE